MKKTLAESRPWRQESVSTAKTFDLANNTSVFQSHGPVQHSSAVSQRRACCADPPHISALGCRLPHTRRRVGWPGVLPTNIRKMLVEAGAKHSKIKSSAGRSAQTLLMPGTTLIREWDELEYRVTVTLDGLYALDGQVFKSLSAAARHISGTQWNGPKFFGLRSGKGDGQ